MDRMTVPTALVIPRRGHSCGVLPSTGSGCRRRSRSRTKSCRMDSGDSCGKWRVGLCLGSRKQELG